MPGLLFWNSLMAAIAWLIVLTRLISVLRHQPHLSPNARWRVWLFWCAFFSFAVVVTIYHPFVQQLLSVSGWLRDIPIIAIAIVAYVIGAHICYGFAPVFRPRWNWPLYAGIMALAVCVLIGWATHSWPIVSRPLTDTATFPRLVFAAFLLVVLGRIVLPAYIWAWRHEEQQPMRLRFRLIAGMHGSIALWLLLRIGETAAWAVGLTLNLGLVYVVLGVLITLSFSAHFLPIFFFVQMTQIINYLRNISTYFYIRRVEVYAARLIPWRLGPIGWQDVIREPAFTIYQCVIAILDMRKMLRRCNHVDAQDLSDRFDDNMRPDMSYDEIVTCLRDIGRSLGGKRPTDQSRLSLSV